MEDLPCGTLDTILIVGFGVMAGDPAA